MPKKYLTNCWRCSIRVTADGGARGDCRSSRRALQIERPLVDIETISLRIRMAAVIIHTDPHVTNRHDTEQILLVLKGKRERAVSHELVTLIAAAVAATDEWSTTAGHV